MKVSPGSGKRRLGEELVVFCQRFFLICRKQIDGSPDFDETASDDSPQLVEMFDILSSAYESGVVHGLKTPKEAVHDAALRTQKVIERWR